MAEFGIAATTMLVAAGIGLGTTLLAEVAAGGAVLDHTGGGTSRTLTGLGLTASAAVGTAALGVAGSRLHNVWTHTDSPGLLMSAGTGFIMGATAGAVMGTTLLGVMSGIGLRQS